MSGIEIPPSFRSVVGLGEPVRVYGQSAASRWASVIVCAVFYLLALGIGYYGGVFYPQAYPQVASTNAPFILGVGVLVLLGTMFWAWRIYARWHETAVVYQDGFAHFAGKHVRALKWSEIASILMRVVEMRYYGVIPAGTQRNYTIKDQLGSQLKLDGTLNKVEELIDQIRQGAFPHILARSRQAFDAGQSVEFGPISISREQGLQQGRKSLAWSEIARVSLSNGSIQVKPKKGGLFGGLGAPAASIPNLDVFLAIVADMAKEQMQV